MKPRRTYMNVIYLPGWSAVCNQCNGNRIEPRPRSYTTQAMTAEFQQTIRERIDVWYYYNYYYYYYYSHYDVCDLTYLTCHRLVIYAHTSPMSAVGPIEFNNIILLIANVGVVVMVGYNAGTYPGYNNRGPKRTYYTAVASTGGGGNALGGHIV